MSYDRILIVVWAAVVFLGLLAGLETCSRTITTTTQIQAGARIRF